MQVVDGERINPFAAESSYKLSDRWANPVASTITT